MAAVPCCCEPPDRDSDLCAACGVFVRLTFGNLCARCENHRDDFNDEFRDDPDDDEPDE